MPLQHHIDRRLDNDILVDRTDIGGQAVHHPVGNIILRSRQMTAGQPRWFGKERVPLLLRDEAVVMHGVDYQPRAAPRPVEIPRR